MTSCKLNLWTFSKKDSFVKFDGRGTLISNLTKTLLVFLPQADPRRNLRASVTLWLFL